MSSYLETLQLYYEEEIEGEAYFSRLATRFPDPDHRHKFSLLAQVERHAAEGVAPLIERHGLSPRSNESLVASGNAEADQTVPDWAALLGEMRESYAGYLRAFEELEKLGPAEDRDLLSFLTEHEVAAIKFLDLEATNPTESATPLDAYIATPAASWRAVKS